MSTFSKLLATFSATSETETSIMLTNTATTTPCGVKVCGSLSFLCLSLTFDTNLAVRASSALDMCPSALLRLTKWPEVITRWSQGNVTGFKLFFCPANEFTSCWMFTAGFGALWVPAKPSGRDLGRINKALLTPTAAPRRDYIKKAKTNTHDKIY